MLIFFYLCLHFKMIDWGCLETFLESQKYLQLFSLLLLTVLKFFNGLGKGETLVEKLQFSDSS